jgi:hypothetical protein
MTKPKTAEQKAKPKTAKKLPVTVVKLPGKPIPEVAEAMKKAIKTKTRVVYPTTTVEDFNAVSATEHIEEIVYSTPSKTILLNKVFHWGDHITIGNTTVPIEKAGKMGSKGFMLVFDNPQQAENQFPGEGTIEV